MWIQRHAQPWPVESRPLPEGCRNSRGPTYIASRIRRVDLGSSANNRINLGVIGMGWQGSGNTKSYLASDDCQVVAACDIEQDHLQAAVKMINNYYGNEDCKGYHDYRELLARDDIDAVMIAVPDHWHEIVATEDGRCRRGTDFLR